MSASPRIETARAKINLTLHVDALAADGYHPLHSLVVFADIGDKVEMRPAKGNVSTLTIKGPFSTDLPADDSNLILKTAGALTGDKFDFFLTKNLPIASGIGGGSADAAATARLIGREFACDELLNLGADIPVCIKSQTSLMQGKGERLTPLPGLGQIHAVLVNPGVAVSTGAVFRQFDEEDQGDRSLPNEVTLGSDLLRMALAGRNDLQNAAISIAPQISEVIEILAAEQNCKLARMSGSGATCFGLFPDAQSAQTAATKITQKHPDWWCVQAVLGDLV